MFKIAAQGYNLSYRESVLLPGHVSAPHHDGAHLICNELFPLFPFFRVKRGALTSPRKI